MSHIVKLGVYRRRKITKEQTEELIAFHVEHGFEASSKRCVELGLNPKYAAIEANVRGFRTSRRKNRSAPNEAPKEEISNHTYNDPRWERAKRIGAVVA
jgi:hypothetical protein